jgi:membrane-associated protease RseP (regulator of RpoE activity)
VKRYNALGILIVLGLFSAGISAAERGWFGIAVDPDGPTLNQPVRAVTVLAVSESSPAALAGLQPGDAIVEIESVPVAAMNADVIRRAMHRSVGETLRLKIIRGTGSIREISMVAIGDPAIQSPTSALNPLIFSILTWAAMCGATTFLAVRQMVKRRVERLRGQARLEVPFTGADGWNRVEGLITRYERRMRVNLFAALLFGVVFGACIGALNFVLHNMSQRG